MTRHVVDSSAWLEYFADGPSAEHFAPIIEKLAALLVPTITLFEVFKRVAVQRDENDAITCMAVMQQGEVAPIDAEFEGLQGVRYFLKPVSDLCLAKLDSISAQACHCHADRQHSRSQNNLVSID